MTIAVLYDFGINRGGGDFVMLSILDALNRGGCDLILETSNVRGLHESKEFFHKEMNSIDIHQIRTPVLLQHPYTIAYMARKIVKEKYDAVILSDDVPKCLYDMKVVCYVHYPHIARLKHPAYDTRKRVNTLKGRFAMSVHKRIFPQFYPNQCASDKWFFVANSMITKDHVSETLCLEPRKVALLHPPVASTSIMNFLKEASMDKEDMVTCIGRFEPNKRFEDLIHALTLISKSIDAEASLIGFGYDRDYLRRLKKIIDSECLGRKIEINLDVNREVVLDILSRAKALVHLSCFEPFGIAVVEGMAAKCIPIVRKGSNGPWMEITERGKYGLGFDTIEGLAAAIEKAIKDYQSFSIKEIASRALDFDEPTFQSCFLKLLTRFLDND